MIEQRILIVDDEPSNIRMLGEALKGAFEVFFALNGKKAIEKALSPKPPDLILLDIIMPEMDGYEVCERLKSDKKTKNIPIIFITSKTDEGDEYRGLNLGAVDYITKPFNPAIVLARITTHLDLKKHHDQLEILVQERSAALIKVNQWLQQEIAERIKMEEEARLHREQLIQADKMVALGTLVSGVAHEINNPNNFITLNAPMLKKIWRNVLPVLDEYYGDNDDTIMGFEYGIIREKFFQACDNILEGSSRIRQIVEDLRKFSQKNVTDVLEQVDVNAVVTSSINLLNNLIGKTTDRFSVKLNEIPFISCNFQHLEQVVINLVQNACQAISDRSQALWVETHYDEKSERISIVICDEGVGISPEHLPRITEPFFTTKRDTGGTGLGLSISSRIIGDYGGTLEFGSMPGKGTKAVIALPIRRISKSIGEE